MFNFEEKFNLVKKQMAVEQRKIQFNSCLQVFYGITLDNYLRISFVSKIRPYEMVSTKELKVVQGKEADNVYWTCFDLINNSAEDVFYIFCDSLLDSILNIEDEYQALNYLRNRYYAWKTLLKSKGKMSYENCQGLFGELSFIYKFLSKKIGYEEAIKSWVGPQGFSKDFSVSNTWYEIKTIGSSSESVKINSLTQLDSDIYGHLVVIIVEKMSNDYDVAECNIDKLFKLILSNIDSHQIKEDFINKMLQYGYSDDDNQINEYKFEIKNISFYNVNNDFPRLTKEMINNKVITKVAYEISLSAIDKYLEE